MSRGKKERKTEKGAKQGLLTGRRALILIFLTAVEDENRAKESGRTLRFGR